MIEVKTYEKGDLWKLNGRLISKAKNTPYWEYKIAIAESITMRINGEIEACAGCAYNNGTWELWSAPSKRMVAKHMHYYARQMKQLVHRIGKSNISVAVHADVDDSKTMRWLEWLGFEQTSKQVTWKDTTIVIMRISLAKVGNSHGS